MKKLAIVAAIAAAASGAYAAPISSNITGVELTVSNTDIVVDCATGTYNSGFTSGLALSGITTAGINFLGAICLDPSLGTPYVALDFGLHGHAVTTPFPGTVFDGGQIDIYTDFGSGWGYAYTVVAATSPVNCLDDSGTTQGLVWSTPGTTALPGTNSGTNAVCETTLFSMASSLYLIGTKTF